MVNNDTVIQTNFESELKEGNENNFGPNKLLYFLDQSLINLVKDLQLKAEITSSVYKQLFKKEITLNNDKPDNFTEILIKYKSAQVTGEAIDTVRRYCTLLNLNNDLSKLDGLISSTAALKISDFIRKLVYQTSEDYHFDIHLDQDDFYLSLTVFSPKEFQSVVIEIF